MSQKLQNNVLYFPTLPTRRSPRLTNVLATILVYCQWYELTLERPPFVYRRLWIIEMSHFYSCEEYKRDNYFAKYNSMLNRINEISITAHGCVQLTIDASALLTSYIAIGDIAAILYFISKKFFFSHHNFIFHSETAPNARFKQDIIHYSHLINSLADSIISSNRDV